MPRQSRTNRSFKDEAGFTMVELAVVLLIVGLLLFLVLPNLDYAVPKYRIRANGREIASLYEYARAQATAKGIVHYIQYDMKEGKALILVPIPHDPYGSEDEDIYASEDPEEENVAPVKPVSYKWEPLMEKFLSKGVKFNDVIYGSNEKKSSGTVTIKISPFGVNAPHTIHLKDEDDREFTIMLNGLTGRPTFFSEYVDPPEVLKDSEF